MAYYHVIAKLTGEGGFIALFSDLTRDDLHAKFVRPYEMGRDFLSGGNVIPAGNVRSIKIIETNRDSETERDEINKRSRARIDEINRSSDSVYFVSIGSGSHPEDIEEGGEDVTSVYIKGPPGYALYDRRPSASSNGSNLATKSTWKTVAAWVASILSAVAAAGIAKYLGWV